MEKEWFRQWFDSDHYQLLYRNRDTKEAELFINSITGFTKPAPGCRVLDLACGRGRHAILLAEKGYDVTGTDLSPQNIRLASRHEKSNLSFYVHDMRDLFRINYFDIVLNLFTSFGYFEKESDDRKAIGSAAKALKKGGTFVLDFLNAKVEKENLVEKEEISAGGILFKITRKFDSCFFVKNIEVTDGGTKHLFCEKVKALSAADFGKLFAGAGLEITHLAGDYALSPFNENTSERLIIFAVKP